MKLLKRLVLLAAPLSVLPACTIKTSVKPVEGGNVNLVCVKQNDAVFSKGFGQGVVDLLGEKGVKSILYSADAPEGCSHRLEYFVEWKWDLATYLYRAKLNVYAGHNLVGEALYDASKGAGSMSKFGTTAEKISPLLDQLFSGPGKPKT